MSRQRHPNNLWHRRCDCFAARPALASTPMAKTDSTTLDDDRIARFESSLDELESIVQHMEEGKLSLDESLNSFERGIALYRHCEQALKQAELRVQQLLDPEDPDSAVSFDPDAS